MGTEIKVWQLKDGKLEEIQDNDLAAAHHEKELEGWIAEDTSLLGSDLLVIGRQHDIPNVGTLDLLCIDENGALVVIEFKRNSSNRETVAQVLDYASWLNTASEEEIEACAEHYFSKYREKTKSLSEAFSEYFENDLQALTPQNHRMLVVAPKLDTSAERIINYLAGHGVNINAVFFRYAKTAEGDEMLIRTILVPEATRPGKAREMTEAQLLARATELRTTKLVEICRNLSSETEEKPAAAYAGSFRYWFKGKMIFGTSVMGERRKPLPPPGQLDVWIPAPNLSKVTAVPEEKIRKALREDFAAKEAGENDCIIRLKSPEEAQKLVTLIRDWIATPARADRFVWKEGDLKIVKTADHD